MMQHATKLRNQNRNIANMVMLSFVLDLKEPLAGKKKGEELYNV